jgi:hypothetical protein
MCESVCIEAVDVAVAEGKKYIRQHGEEAISKLIDSGVVPLCGSACLEQTKVDMDICRDVCVVGSKHVLEIAKRSLDEKVNK